MPNWGGGARGAAGGAAAGSTFGPWGAAIGGTIGGLAGLFGGSNNDRALVPKDLQGLRQQNIDLLSAFLRPGAFGPGGAGMDFFFGGQNGAANLLNTPSPEMQTYDKLRPILEGMMTGTGPQFERDIGMANATGGRFGSANAILRGEALRNLFNQRNQTAGTLGMLSQAAGSSQFDRRMAVQSQQLQLLAGLLGMSGQATLSAPIQQGDNDNGMLDIMKLIATVGMNRGQGSGGPA